MKTKSFGNRLSKYEKHLPKLMTEFGGISVSVVSLVNKKLKEARLNNQLKDLDFAQEFSGKDLKYAEKCLSVIKKNEEVYQHILDTQLDKSLLNDKTGDSIFTEFGEINLNSKNVIDRALEFAKNTNQWSSVYELVLNCRGSLYKYAKNRLDKILFEKR